LNATPSGTSMSAFFNPGARFRRMNQFYIILRSNPPRVPVGDLMKVSASPGDFVGFGEHPLFPIKSSALTNFD
jgi:hypothetical protein